MNRTKTFIPLLLSILLLLTLLPFIPVSAKPASPLNTADLRIGESSTAVYPADFNENISLSLDLFPEKVLAQLKHYQAQFATTASESLKLSNPRCDISLSLMLSAGLDWSPKEADFENPGTNFILDGTKGLLEVDLAHVRYANQYKRKRLIPLRLRYAVEDFAELEDSMSALSQVTLSVDGIHFGQDFVSENRPLAITASVEGQLAWDYEKDGQTQTLRFDWDDFQQKPGLEDNALQEDPEAAIDPSLIQLSVKPVAENQADLFFNLNPDSSAIQDFDDKDPSYISLGYFPTDMELAFLSYENDVICGTKSDLWNEMSDLTFGKLQLELQISLTLPEGMAFITEANEWGNSFIFEAGDHSPALVLDEKKDITLTERSLKAVIKPGMDLANWDQLNDWMKEIKGQQMQFDLLNKLRWTKDAKSGQSYKIKAEVNGILKGTIPAIGENFNIRWSEAKQRPDGRDQGAEPGDNITLTLRKVGGTQPDPQPGLIPVKDVVLSKAGAQTSAELVENGHFPEYENWLKKIVAVEVDGQKVKYSIEEVFIEGELPYLIIQSPYAPGKRFVIHARGFFDFIWQDKQLDPANSGTPAEPDEPGNPDEPEEPIEKKAAGPYELCYEASSQTYFVQLQAGSQWSDDAQWVENVTEVLVDGQAAEFAPVSYFDDDLPGGALHYLDIKGRHPQARLFVLRSKTHEDVVLLPAHKAGSPTNTISQVRAAANEALQSVSGIHFMAKKLAKPSAREMAFDLSLQKASGQPVQNQYPLEVLLYLDPQDMPENKAPQTLFCLENGQKHTVPFVYDATRRRLAFTAPHFSNWIISWGEENKPITPTPADASPNKPSLSDKHQQPGTAGGFALFSRNEQDVPLLLKAAANVAQNPDPQPEKQKQSGQKLPSTGVSEASTAWLPLLLGLLILLRKR